MAKRSRTYIWQFTIGLGFLSGLWTAIGIDPEEVVLNLLGTVTGEIFPDPTLRQLFIILPTILLLLSVWGRTKRVRYSGSHRCSSRTWPGFPSLSRSGPRCFS